ncbi:MAG: UvrD-helicase domain-containing protein [Clostridia bacterium]|nr:UvrD-helicase domain-containing protein [Clostridia bacterium]
MAERKLTPAQRDAVRATGDVIVSAAAGSGKTFVLTERVISRITGDDPIPADSLLIVTFTNAAAAEMKDRICARFEKEIERSPLDPALLRQQLLLERAEITTIDSFCARLVRENFESSGLPADFRPADKGRLEEMKKSAADRTVEYYCETEDREFFALSDAVSSGRGDGGLMEVVEKVRDFLSSVPYPDEWKRDALKSYRARNIKDTVWYSVICENALSWAEDIATSLTLAQGRLALLDGALLNKNIGEEMTADLGFARAVSAAVSGGDTDGANRLCSEKGGKISCSHACKKLDGNPDFEIMQANISVAQKRLEKLTSLLALLSGDPMAQVASLRPVAEKFFEVLEMYTGFLRDEMDSCGCYDFSDIERAALSLLCVRENGVTRPTGIGRALSARYREIMVDEYQDTNDLQNELFSVLSDGRKHLFTVGDVKQSIYGFRQANPDNFIARLNSVPYFTEGVENGKIILTGNYRSRGSVCEFVNFLFELLLSRESAGIDYDGDQKLVSANPDFAFENSSGGAALHVVSRKEKGVDGEAAHIASEILRLSKEECVTLSGGDGHRRPEWKDFAILLRSRSDMASYALALRNSGIPAVCDDTGGFTDEPTVKKMLAVLRTVDNPSDDTAFLAAMLSPVFGFTPDDVVAVRGRLKRVPFVESLRNAASKNEKAERMLRLLEQMRVAAARLPVDALLRYIYDLTGVRARAAASGDKRAAAQLDRLITLAEGYELSNPDGGLAGFVRRIENSTDLSPAGVCGDNAVRIMSVHRSKGLEFPLCFVAGLSKEFNDGDEKKPCLTDRVAGLGFWSYDPSSKTRSHNVTREALKMRIRSRNISEELRVLYVAATRARDYLCLVMSFDDAEKAVKKAVSAGCTSLIDAKTGRFSANGVRSASSFSELILAAAALHPDGGELRRIAGVEDGETPSGPFTVEIKVVASPEPVKAEKAEISCGTDNDSDPRMTEMIEKALSWSYPYSRLNGIAAKASVTDIAEKRTAAENACSSRPAFLSRQGLTPAQRGTAMHYFLENADFSRAAEDVAAEARRLADGGFITEKQEQCLDLSRLRAFFESEVFGRISRSKQVWRELRFMTELPVCAADPLLGEEFSGERIVVQGIADCVFLEEDGAVLLDYKTDRVSDLSVLCERYSSQLEIYAEALSKTLGVPVKEKILYSLTLSQQVSI